MAMDALKNLVNNIPDWQRRLEDLGGQIERRQSELGAAIAAPDGNKSDRHARSLRNVGSSESLKPADDGPMHPNFDKDFEPPNGNAEGTQLHLQRTPSTPTRDHQMVPGLPPSPGSENRAELHKQACEAVAAHTRALVQARKKRKASSMVSVEGGHPVYRTRSMIIVYYDSYVQGFFDDLVRFISSSRNLMRKAKMAAKVSQIKRMAELEIADDATRTGEERTAIDNLPSLRYMSTRQLGPIPGDKKIPETSRPSPADEPADVYDELDKSLEFVQSTCEHGAHQFLRDADCYEEIKKIKERLVGVLAAAQQEIERVKREDPELARETGELGKARMHRPISVRRDMTSDRKDDGLAEKERRLTFEVTPSKAVNSQDMGTVEVDPNLDEADLDEILPTLQYRSTRLMRSRAG